VLDDGRLTDGQGRTVDFRNTIIVMTSNLAPTLSRAGWRSAIPGDESGGDGKSQPTLSTRVYQPYRRGRGFPSLGREQIRAISGIQIEYLRQRLLDKEIGFEMTDAALDLLGEAGFDPVYGARPMKRAIQQQLENPLAQEILSGYFAAGDTIKWMQVTRACGFSKINCFYVETRKSRLYGAFHKIVMILTFVNNIIFCLKQVSDLVSNNSSLVGSGGATGVAALVS